MPIKREAAYLHSFEYSQGLVLQKVLQSKKLNLQQSCSCHAVCFDQFCYEKAGCLVFSHFEHHTVCCGQQPALCERAKATQVVFRATCHRAVIAAKMTAANLLVNTQNLKLQQTGSARR